MVKASACVWIHCRNTCQPIASQNGIKGICVFMFHFCMSSCLWKQSISLSHWAAVHYLMTYKHVYTTYTYTCLYVMHMPSLLCDIAVLAWNCSRWLYDPLGVYRRTNPRTKNIRGGQVIRSNVPIGTPIELRGAKPLENWEIHSTCWATHVMHTVLR